MRHRNCAGEAYSFNNMCNKLNLSRLSVYWRRLEHNIYDVVDSESGGSGPPRPALPLKLRLWLVFLVG